MMDILIDTIIDTLKLVPFLFVSFILMEVIEHKLNNKKILEKTNKFGPIVGSLLGIIPQCGMTAMASNLYSVRVITLGTLMSIFLSCSDEMLPMLIANRASFSLIMKILLVKVLLGMLMGLIIDFVNRKKVNSKVGIEEMCDNEHCHCEDGIFISSLKHTMKIVIFIFVISLILNSFDYSIYIDKIINNSKIIAPIILSFVGLIPNCASSILITKLYLDDIILFGSMISGLLVSSGVGILVLFRQNKSVKENIMIVLLLVIISSIWGIIFNFVNF